MAPFLAINSATGKGFEAMSIATVTVGDGMITHIYNLEDLTSVVAQLTVDQAPRQNP